MSAMMNDFFITLENFLNEEVSPCANNLDDDTDDLKNIYKKLIDLGALKLLIPTEYGGFGGERMEWIKFNMLMAKFSGALLFLQAQHQFAIAQLKLLLPHSQAIFYLTKIAQENYSIGVFLAAQKVSLHVKEDDLGLRISGTLPWVTGNEYFTEILISFAHAENIYFSCIPFHSKNNKINFSQNIPTVVFKAANNVELTLESFLIETNQLISVRATDVPRVQQHPVIYHFAGLTQTLLTIAAQGKYFKNEFAKATYAKLLNESEKYYQQIVNEVIPPQQLRAQGLLLTEQCALFARMTNGASALLQSHPLPRICREIWQYTSAGYSQAQADAYLQESYV